MVKQFSVPCDFGGQKSPVTLYVGEPNADSHPLNFQGKWLSETKGGQVPSSVMEAIQKIYHIAKRNNINFEDLCAYAISKAYNTKNSDDSDTEDADLNEKMEKVLADEG